MVSRETTTSEDLLELTEASKFAKSVDGSHIVESQWILQKFK